MSQKAARCVYQQVVDYSATAVSDAAWVQLSASLPDNITELEVGDTSGHAMVLGYGPAGSEQILAYVQPGGEATRVQALLNKGMRFVIKGQETSTTVSSGKLFINGYR